MSAFCQKSVVDMEEDEVLEKLQNLKLSVLSDSSFLSDGEALEDVVPPTPIANEMRNRGTNGCGGDSINNRNGNSSYGSGRGDRKGSLESLDLLDVDGADDPDEDMYQWLVPSSGEELFGDNKSWMDTRLLDTQFRLLNVVKEKLFEEKSGAIRRSTAGPAIGRVVPQASSEDRFKTYRRTPRQTSVLPQQSSGVEYVSNPAEIFTSPVRNRSLWNEYRGNTTPNFSPIPANNSNKQISTPGSGCSEMKSETPSEKVELDYRTFTRASARNKAAVSSAHPEYTSSPNSSFPFVSSGTDTITIRPARLKYGGNRNVNLNETFIHSDDFEGNHASQSPHNTSYVIACGPNLNPNNTDLNASYTIARNSEPNCPHHNMSGQGDRVGENTSPPQAARNLSYIVEDGKGDIHPRRASLTHNLSFTIERKEDTKNLNNVQALNTTFDKSQEDITNHFAAGGSNGSVNLGSLEELHTRARKQEESLKMSSPSRIISRRETHVINIPNIDGSLPRPPPRTSSTDTYCVGQSNPDSPLSSGLSSPLDSQSYDDISSESFRRSMPNLAINKRLSINTGLSLAPPLNNLQSKNYHTSDSKLSHSRAFSTLTITKPRGGKSITRPGVSEYSSKETHIGQRYGGSAIRPSIGISGSNEIPRQPSPAMKAPLSGRLPAPRYSSKPTYMQATGSTTSLPSATSVTQTQPIRPASQIPGRLTSRIPGPGISRLRPPSSRPASSSQPRYTSIPKQSEWQDGCY